MKNQLLTVFTVLAVYLVAMPSFADNNGAEYLVKMGKDHLQKGQRDMAIHEFSKALMMDPHNETALKELHSLGIDQGLYSGARTSLERLSAMSEEINAYKTKLQDLEKHKAILESMLKQADVANLDLSLTNGQMDQDINSLQEGLTVSQLLSEEEAKQHLEQMKLMSKQQEADKALNEKEMMALNEQLKNKMTPRITIGAVDSGDLASLRHRLNSTVERSLDYEKELAAYHDENSQLKKFVEDQYAHQDKLIHVLEDYLHLREDHLSDAKDHLVYRELDLANTDDYLVDKIDELIQYNEDFGEYIVHIGDETFFLDEQNSYIKFLRERFDQMQDEMSSEHVAVSEKVNMLIDQDKYLLSLQAELEDAQKQIQRLLKDREDFLNAVKEEITE